MYVERRVAPGVDLWRSEANRAGETRILPDACLDVLFDGERLLVAGPDATARVHHGLESGTVWAVRLHAGLGPALLGVPAGELVGSTVPLEDVLGGAARTLASRTAKDPRALATWARTARADPLGERLVLLLRRASASVAADTLGYSARQLQRRCRDLFGYGPQHLARVLRLTDTVALADAGHPWADIASLAGYADQAHLSHDVRELAGLTPTALRASRRADPTSASAGQADPSLDPQQVLLAVQRVGVGP